MLYRREGKAAIKNRIKLAQLRSLSLVTFLGHKVTCPTTTFLDGSQPVRPDFDFFAVKKKVGKRRLIHTSLTPLSRLSCAKVENFQCCVS